MAISKYNAEGYYDPTVYAAIKQADAETNKFKITYPSGYMELNLDVFFPCTRDKGKKVFRLIRRYSSYADKDRLLSFLKGKANEYSEKMREYADLAFGYSEKSKEYQWYNSNFKQARLLRQRTLMNIEMLNEGSRKP